MIKRTSQSSIISICILDIDPRVKDKVFAMQRLLVDISLFGKTEGCNLNEIEFEINNIIENEKLIGREELLLILDTSVKTGNIEIIGNGCWRLSEERQKSLSESIVALDKLRKDFHNGMEKAIEARLKERLDEAEMDSICTIIENYLVETIRAEVLELSSGLVKFEDFVNHYEDGATRETLDARLDTSLNEKFSHLRISQIVASVRDYFRNLPMDGLKYLETLQVRVLGGELLKLDPESGHKFKDYFLTRKLFLDTNVLISLLFERDEYHELIPDVITLSNALGCSLLVTNQTVIEYQGQIEKAEKIYWKIKENALARKLGTELEDVIVQTYFAKLKNNPNLDWDAYITVFKNTEDILFSKNILVEKIDTSINISNSDCQQIEEVLRQFKPNATPNALTHDAYMMLVTEQYRHKYNLDELGSKVWFLTLDYGILKSQKELKRYLYPFSWLEAKKANEQHNF